MGNKTLIFDNNDPSLPHDPNLVSTLDRIHFNHPDPSCHSYKHLGILFDEHLSFSLHIDSLKSKLSKALFIINRVKNIVPQKTLKTLYFTLFHSHLLYCPLIVSCASKACVNKIVIMQKKAIRTITNSKATSHTEPLFTSLKILTYHNIIYKAQLLFFHSIHFNYAPSTFTNSWKKNLDRNTQHELRNANEYQIPLARLTMFTRFPLYTLPKTWNNAGIITCYSNPTTFKIALNDELLHGNEINRVQLYPYPYTREGF